MADYLPRYKPGESITSQASGTIASGTVTAGDIVVCAASGQVSTLAAVTTPTAADVTSTRAIVGVALTTATTGNIVDVQMDR
jgi:sulfate adenylyltransferase subunit 1 (EFTu-like GTPase family)